MGAEDIHSTQYIVATNAYTLMVSALGAVVLARGMYFIIGLLDP